MAMLADIREEDEKAVTPYLVMPDFKDLQFAKTKAEQVRDIKISMKRDELKERREVIRLAAKQLGHKLGAWSGTTSASCKRCGAETDFKDGISKKCSA